jgi:hypothetical protein
MRLRGACRTFPVFLLLALLSPQTSVRGGGFGASGGFGVGALFGKEFDSEDLPVRFVAPRDGQEFASAEDAVLFAFAFGGAAGMHHQGGVIAQASSGFTATFHGSEPRVCFTVQNKRESYHASTHCVDDPMAPFLLSGFKPGIWQACAYLLERGFEDQKYWRGGHVRTVGGWSGQHCVAFAVDVPAWRRSAQLSARTSEVPQRPLRRGNTSSPSGNFDFDAREGGEYQVQLFNRLKVFRIANAMLDSAAIRGIILRESRWRERQQNRKAFSDSFDRDPEATAGSIVVTMANAGHLQLALNLLVSLRKARRREQTAPMNSDRQIEGAVVFALDDDTARSLEAFGAAAVRVPQVSSYCAHCAGSFPGEGTDALVSTEAGEDEAQVSISGRVKEGRPARKGSGLRDVWSEGFADIAILKPACVLTVLHLGVHTLWADTDIVFFRDPFPSILLDVSSDFVPTSMPTHDSMLPLHVVTSKERSVLHAQTTGPFPDLTIQAAGDGDLHYPADEREALRNELCTGLFLARSNNRSVALFEQIVHALALFSHVRTFGDQSATNLVLFESRWRDGIAGLTVAPMDPLLYPSGGIFFKTSEHVRRGIAPVLVHNNYLIGLDKKIARFRNRRLWFLDGNGEGAALSALRGFLCGSREMESESGVSSWRWLQARQQRQTRRIHRLKAFLRAQLSVMELTGVRLSGNVRHRSSPQYASNVFFEHPCGASIDRRHLIIVVSLGERPWFPTFTLPRLQDYAGKIGSDLLVLQELSYCHRGEHRSTALNGCAKSAKLFTAAAALSKKDMTIADGHGFDRVTIVDDTMIFRRDSPDVFELVPPCSLGASVEGKAVRSLEAQNAITRMSLLRYAETIKGVASSHIESGAEDILLHCSQGDIEEMVSIGALTFGGHVQEVIIRDISSSSNQDSSCVHDKARFDPRWFNSGLLVLSTRHRELLEYKDAEKKVDFVLLWDQGIINAKRRLLGVPLFDLGYNFNWVGSFNGSNAKRRPFDATDAYAAHATTGLPGFGRERMGFLADISTVWSDRGI